MTQDFNDRVARIRARHAERAANATLEPLDGADQTPTAFAPPSAESLVQSILDDRDARPRRDIFRTIAQLRPIYTVLSLTLMVILTTIVIPRLTGLGDGGGMATMQGLDALMQPGFGSGLGSF